MTAPAHCFRRGSRSGFTLIELLTVIAIIAVLAGLVVGMTSGAKTARVNSRAQADLRKLQTAIEAYKADRNSYPPDHLLAPGSLQRVDPATSPLYYELRGMEVVNGVFRPRGETESLTPEAVRQAFGRRGFLNSSADAAEPARGYMEFKASEVRKAQVNGVEVNLLVTPFDWPPNTSEAAPLAGSKFNPWRYVSTSPTNNTGGFDLWAEVYVGKEKKLFKNW